MNTMFRLYSKAPVDLRRAVNRIARSSLVRFDGLRFGRLGFYKMTIVIDDLKTAEAFQDWLDKNSVKVGPATLGFEGKSAGEFYRLHRRPLLRWLWSRFRGFRSRR